MRHISLRIIAALLPCTGCAAIATQDNTMRAAVVVGVSHGAAERRIFQTKLRSAPSAEAPTNDHQQTAWGSARLVVAEDNSFEYLITIFNPRHETFTGAQLVRADGVGAGEVVGTLFSDVMVRDWYIQLRGTLTVNRTTRATDLAADVREHPGAFVVRVPTAAQPTGAIFGRME